MNIAYSNAKKSKVMRFGKSFRANFVPITIDCVSLDVVREWRYLGNTLLSGKTLSYSARPDISAFFRVTNSVIRALDGAHEQVLVNLVYFTCVPILTYACDVKEYSACWIATLPLIMLYERYLVSQLGRVFVSYARYLVSSLCMRSSKMPKTVFYLIAALILTLLSPSL